MRRILAITTRYDKLVEHETIELLDDNDSLRQLIERECQNRDEWFGIYVYDFTSECYEPISCRPGACAYCNKFDPIEYVAAVVKRIQNPPECWCYLFFEEDSITGEFVELKIL